MVNINVDSEVELVSGSDKVITHASPTNSLKYDLVLSLGGDTSKPNTISSLALVDDNDVERAYASISGSDWSFSNITNGKRATCTKIVNIPESFNVYKVRLYGGNVVYFEYVLTTPKPVTGGGLVTVSITIDVTLTVEHVSGGTLVDINIPNYGGEELLKRFTTGERRGKRINTVQLVYQGGTIAVVTCGVVTDTDNFRVVVTATHYPSSDLTIDEYDYSTEDLYVIIRVLIQSLTLGAGIGHTWNLTIQF